MESENNPIKPAEEIGKILEGIPNKPDDKTNLEKNIAHKMGNELVDKVHNDNIARIKYSEAIFTVTVMWLFFVLVTVVAVGKGFLKLSDTVLITLITTTTVAVFGFFLAVVNYYFNKDKST